MTAAANHVQACFDDIAITSTTIGSTKPTIVGSAGPDVEEDELDIPARGTMRPLPNFHEP